MPLPQQHLTHAQFDPKGHGVRSNAIRPIELFELHFAADEYGGGRRVEFYASDIAAAFAFAESYVLNAMADLWQGGKRLCTIQRLLRQ